MGALEGCWAFWRALRAGFGSLQEAQTTWSIDDIADMNDALDIEAEAEQNAINEARQKNGSS